MYFKKKNGAYWVWSSLKASLDCMPIFKFKNKEEVFDFIGKPEAWSQEIDMSASDVNIYNLDDKINKLYPFPVVHKKHATDDDIVKELIRISKATDYANSFKGVKERIRIIDAIILKGLRV